MKEGKKSYKVNIGVKGHFEKKKSFSKKWKRQQPPSIMHSMKARM